MEPSERETWKVLKTDERCVRLESDRKGAEVVWTQGTRERERWELGVKGLVCFRADN